MSVVIDGTNGVTASASFLGTGPFTGSYSDGIVADYTSGVGRISVGGSDALAFYRGGIASTESMRLDSSGNVGIGTSSNLVFDNVAAARPLVVQSSSSSTTVTGSTNAITICNSDTTTNNSSQLNFAAITGASTNQYSSAIISCIYGARTNGQYPTGQLVFSTSTALNTAPSEKMRIDSSGNLGVGLTSIPNAQGNSIAVGNTSGANINITCNGVAGSAGAPKYLDLRFLGYNNEERAKIRSWDEAATSGNGNLTFWTGAAGSTAERARIDSSGQVGINRTPSANGGFLQVGYDSGVSAAIRVQTTTSGTAGELLNFINSSNATAGKITYGSGQTSVVYGTTSDYRLKEDVQPMTSALMKIAALNPVTYKWKATGEASEGFIAHELQAVVPDCVTGEKDAVDADGNPIYQSIDTSFLVATLTAAIQELKAELDATKAEVAALKGQA